MWDPETDGMVYRKRSFPDSLQASNRVDIGQVVLDEIKHPVPFGSPEIVSGDRQVVLIFGDAEVGYCRRNGNRKWSQLYLFTVQRRFVRRGILSSSLRSVLCPGKVGNRVAVHSNGEELHCVHENLQRLSSVVR
jgi:hypothetical protein